MNLPLLLNTLALLATGCRHMTDAEVELRLREARREYVLRPELGMPTCHPHDRIPRVLSQSSSGVLCRCQNA